MNKPTPSLFRALVKTIVLVAVIGALLSMRMMVMGLGYVAIFLIFWLPYSIYVILKIPERRRVQSCKIGIWFLMIITVLIIQTVRERHVREYADMVVHGIEDFHQKHGRYPESLQEAGFKVADLQDKLLIPQYSKDPQFYYPDSIMIFHMWRYDFEKRLWVNEGD